VSASWPWLALAGLGAFHGLNPAMGWLFAVALGMQRKSRGALLASLLPIAIGHALSIAIVVAVLALASALVDLTILQILAGLGLIGFGLYRLVARHKGRTGMQVGFADLVLWSFLMATGHGAGAMLAPVLLEMPMPMMAATAGMHHAALMALGHSLSTGLAAVVVHTLAMLAVAGAVAIVVYEWVGLAFLRRGWINLDLIWALALMAAGALTLLLAFV
jgi:hypothetical protein